MRKTTLLKTMLLLCVLIVGSIGVWADEVTFTITSATAVSTSGTAPAGSAAAFSNTYTNNKVQMTEGNSQTLTLSGYTGCTITQIKLSMHSNNSSGAGKLRYSTDNGTSWTYLVGTSGDGVAFNNAAWNGSWSNPSFVDVTKDVNITATSSNLIIKIEATANSLFCQSFTIIYTPSGDPTCATPTFSPAGGAYNTTQSVTINCGTAGATLHYTTDGTDPTTSSPTYSSAISVTSTTTIKALAVKDGLINSAIATATYYIVYPEASLPFAFNGGKADITNTSGLTHSGLGTDYSANTNPNTQLKFDDANDELVLRINENPGKLTFSIKGNGSNQDPWSGGTFTVQESADGSSYTDVESYNDLGDETSKTITKLKSTTRYIKWIYTTKSFGNVGLGNIRLSPQTEAISTASGKNYATYVTTNDLDFSSVSDDIKAYVAASTASEGVITFTGKDAVPADTPLLIKTTTPGATVNVPVAASTPGSVGTNYLVAGTGSAINYNDGGKYNYILTNGQFKAANNSPVAVGKAYLSLPSAASANELTVNFEDGDGDVTGIKNLTPAFSQGEGVAYNLAGQRVNASHKGLVIVNGKKYLNK